MMDSEEKIERLRKWLDFLGQDVGEKARRGKVHVIELSIPEEIREPKSIASHLQATMKVLWSSIRPEIAMAKGIYVWFWPGQNGEAAWPLYVGKSQHGNSCFRSRNEKHLANACSGKDSLYDWRSSKEQSQLIYTHHAGRKIDFDGHGERMARQFHGMRILTVMMEDSEAHRMAGGAEALMLAAALKLHRAHNVSDRTDQAWLSIMNSFGQSERMAPLGSLFAQAEKTLLNCLLRTPDAKCR
jgi:hypothetical protein